VAGLMGTFNRDRAHALVIFPGALGDLVCFTPALRALCLRHRGLELMAREDLARFAVGRMGIGRNFPSPHSIDRREVSLLFSESQETGTARDFFGGFGRIYSFFANENPHFRQSLTGASGAEVSFHAFRPDGAGHAAASYLRALGEPTTKIESRLEVLPEDRQAASRRLANHGLESQRFALLIPGSGSVHKNWPAPKFAQLASQLQARIPVVIVLGPAEDHLQRYFADCAVLTNLELGELAGIAAAALFFVGNDSGVSHLSAAVGTPGVTLFGPSDPDRWRPLGRVDLISRVPIEEINVAEVARATLAILEAAEQAGPAMSRGS
jgi:ADP-heptose:LPS heptosyltransferase